MIVALVALAILVGPLVRIRRGREVRGELVALRREIDAYARNTGGLPERLGELGFRLYPLFDRGVPVDPWGRPFRYEIARDGRTFSLSSLGPDGVPSVDDVTKRGALPPAAR